MAVTGFDTTLPWSKFKKLNATPAGKDGDAETIATYSSNMGLDRKGNAIVAKNVTITITIDSQQSWAVNGKMNDYLLKHEQGHYDITALGAREFYNKVLKLEAADQQSFQTKMQDLHDDLQKKVDATNERYDNQTDHSKVQAQQAIWDQKIDAAKKNPRGILDDLPQ